MADGDPRTAERRPAIVAVDDEPAVLAAVARDLRRAFGERYRIVRARSGEEALEVLASSLAAAIGSRCWSPTSGCRGCRGPSTSCAPAQIVPGAKRVLLTAYADTEAAIQAINEVGLDYYLLKPWDPPGGAVLPRARGPADDVGVRRGARAGACG